MDAFFFGFELELSAALDAAAANFSLRLRAYSVGVIGWGFSFFPFPFFSAGCFTVFFSCLLVTAIAAFPTGAGELECEDGDEKRSMIED